MTDDQHRVSFGIKTSQIGLTYADILRIWQEADEIPLIQHAWLWDHLIALGPDPAADALEGWTTLAALAARTRRLQVGHLVTSNAIRPPAVLAKMAATVDQISGGRLVLGIGVGGTQQPPDVPNPAVREYAAYGIPLVRAGVGVARLREACLLIRQLWSGDEVMFSGEHYQLVDAVCRPTPVQRPGPPILVAGWGDRTLAVVAEQADLWNVPGPPHNDVSWVVDRSRALSQHCERIGRDPGSIVRSTQLVVDRSEPGAAIRMVRSVVDAGFTHVVVGVRSPSAAGVAAWLADDVFARAL